MRLALLTVGMRISSKKSSITKSCVLFDSNRFGFLKREKLDNFLINKLMKMSCKLHVAVRRFFANCSITYISPNWHESSFIVLSLSLFNLQCCISFNIGMFCLPVAVLVIILFNKLYQTSFSYLYQAATITAGYFFIQTWFVVKRPYNSKENARRHLSYWQQLYYWPIHKQNTWNRKKFSTESIDKKAFGSGKNGRLWY